MELWIRSQKNEELRPLLLKVNEFEIGDYDDDMNCIVVNNLHCVGVYKTKERALEVLDEIKSCLETNSLFNLYSNIGAIPTDFNQKWNYVAVYQMPKE